VIADLKRESGEIIITVTVPAHKVRETFTQIKEEALKGVKVSGFRPGKAPAALAEKSLNEETLAEALFRELVPPAYSQAVSKEGIKPIIPPRVTVKSFKKDADLVFEARTVERPSVELGNFKQTLKSLKGKVIYGPEGKPLKGGEKITAGQVIEKLRESSQVNVPHLLIDHEVQRMLSSLVDQVRGLGLTVEQYLSSQGKSSEELRKEYHKTAERNLKDEFILSEIAQVEGIKVSEKEIEEAIGAAPDEKTKLSLKEERGRAYLEDILRKYSDQLNLAATDTTAYFCGHPEMIEKSKGILLRRGFPKESLREEQYWVQK